MKKCPVEKNCGGCQYLNIAYQQQLDDKKKYVQSLFPRRRVNPTVGMEDPYHYRHKIYATFGTSKTGHLTTGLYQSGTHKLVKVQNCLIQNEVGNQIIKDFCDIAEGLKLTAYDEDRHKGTLRHLYLRISEKTGRVLLVIVIGSRELPKSKELVHALVSAHPEIETIILNQNHAKTSMILGDRERVLYGKEYIEDDIDGVTFRISSRSFFQVNPKQTEKLYKIAIDAAKLTKKDSVLDACCGIGTISLIAAKKAKEVVGVEIVEEAIRDAKFNAKRNGITNADFYCDDANTFLDRLLDKPDVVFLDPPRSGMKQDFMKSLAKMAPNRIVYISCNPKTQARDLKNLTASGYYIHEITPVDMFPFTDHVETVVLMSKVNPGK